MKESKAGAFWGAVASTCGALPYLIYSSVTVGEGAVIVAVSIGALLVFYRRFRWLRETWIVLGTAGAVGYAVGLLRICQPAVSLWQWIAAWIILSVLLLHFGASAIKRAGILVGVGAAVFFAVAAICCISMSDGRSEWGGIGIENAAAGILIIGGCALSGIEQNGRRGVSMAGALTGLSLVLITILSSALVWSRAAFFLLPMPLKSAWQRINTLTFFSCPDMLLCSVASAVTLWQSNKIWVGLRSAIKINRNLFTKTRK